MPLPTDKNCKGNSSVTTESGHQEDDDFIQRAMGDMGKWQIVICTVVSLVKVSVSWHQLAIIFLAPPQDFWCARPTELINVSTSLWRNISSPHISIGRGSCSRFNTTSLDDLLAGNVTDTIPCTSWEFDNSIFSKTIVEEWALVCDREMLSQVAQMLFMLGILIGSFLFGLVADSYGRRMPLIISVIFQVCAGVGTTLATSFTVFLILRFFDAVATAGAMVTSFVIVMEIVGSKWRALVAVLYHVPFSLGHITMAGIAYYFRDWKQYQLAITLPSVLLVCYYWLVPESPRWLLSSGRENEARKILKSAAKRNGLPLQQVDAMIAKHKLIQEESNKKKATFFDLFRYPKLRVYTLCTAYQWIVCGIGFFGLAQYMGQIAGNIFVNIAIGGLLDLPGQLLCIYGTEKLGRKWTLALSMIFTAIACLLIIAVPKGDSSLSWVPVMLSSIGMIAVSTAFPTVYLYSGEIFPTVIRNVGVGFVVMAARIGSMVAPFISGLDTYGTFLPPLIFGVTPLIGFVLCLFLPETKGKKLPDTIEECEQVNKRES